MTSPRRYAVIGKPIAHSLSPRIHTLFAKQLNLPISYDKMEPGTEGFTAMVADFFASGGSGLNVTLPFKGQALELAANCSNGARLAGAANTLKVNSDGTCSACNTDGPGFIRDLTKRYAVSLAAAHVLVIGAGGACAGIINALLLARPASLWIANRTLTKAQELVVRFAAIAVAQGVDLNARDLNQLADCPAGALIINTTSAGHSSADWEFDASVLATASFAYDLNYGPAARNFLELAKQAGVLQSADGIGMLVEQAALSLAYWEGVMPNTDSIYAELAR